MTCVSPSGMSEPVLLVTFRRVGQFLSSHLRSLLRSLPQTQIVHESSRSRLARSYRNAKETITMLFDLAETKS